MSTTGNLSTKASRSEFGVGSLVTALVLWLFVLLFVTLTYTFAARARVLPQIIGYPLLLVTTLSLIREVRAVLLGRHISAGGRPAGEEVPETVGFREEVVPFAWLAALVALVLALGFLVGSAIFIVAFLRLYGKESWRLCIGITLVLFVVIDFGFVQFFGYTVFPGYLPTALGVETGIFGIG